MKNSTISALLLLLCSCIGDNSCHLKDLNLHGKMKNVVEITYKLKSVSDTIMKESEANRYSVFFNSDGCKTKELWNYSNKILDKEIQYFYHPKKNMYEQLFYDHSGDLVVKSVFENNKQGCPSEVNVYTGTGEIQAKGKYIYNTKGLLLEFNSVDNEGKIVFHNKYIYNDAEKIAQKITLTKSGESYRYIYKFDSLQNHIKVETFNQSGELIELKDYTYIYDENMNWIERVETIENKPKELKIRIISYY